MNAKKIQKVAERIAKTLTEHGPMDIMTMFKQLRADGLRITLRELRSMCRLQRIPAWSRGETPPVAIEELKGQLAAEIADGQSLPMRA